MSTVYVFPSSEEDLLGGDATDAPPVRVTAAMDDDDLLARRQGDQLVVWRVSDGAAEWLGEVPVDRLPDDARTELDPDEVRVADDASTLPRALRGVVTAIRDRGA